MNTNDIEKILRKAPQPQPPASLRNQVLAAGVAAAAGGKAPQNASANNGGGFTLAELRSWGRRWWSALIPAGATVLCLGVVVAQQARIRAMEQEIHNRAAAGAPASTAASEIAPPSPQGISTPEETTGSQEQEVERLRGVVAKLEQEVAVLKQAKQSAAGAAVALAPGQDYLTPDEMAGLTGQRDKAMRIMCVNNMKQLGLAARLWATDNQDIFPPSILSMSNELSTPKILVCPADAGRQAATTWDAFTLANCSYEFLAASVPDSEDPSRVLSRCAIHSNVGLFDGSVHMAKPECLVTRDGKLYMMTPATIAPTPKPAASGSNAAAEEARNALVQRYRLSETVTAPQPAPQSP